MWRVSAAGLRGAECLFGAAHRSLIASWHRLLRPLVLCLTVFLLSSCETVPQNEGTPASVAEVVARIKQDIGEYEKYDAIASAVPPLNNACKGVVGFQQDPSMRKLPGWGLARRDQLAQGSSLGIGQGDAPCLVPHAGSHATGCVPNSSMPAITGAQNEHRTDHTLVNGKPR